MADVDDRGQLLLVGALTLAVMLVALAVLLNAAIYTGNVATRDAGPEAGAVIEYENEAMSMARDTMNSLNERDGESYPHLRQNFTDTVGVWSNMSRAHSAASLSDAEVVAVTVRNGTLIRQDEHREFTSNDGDKNWDVANDTTASELRLNVSQDSLYSNDGTEDAIENGFRVTFDDDDDRHVQIYSLDDSNNVTVGVGSEDSERLGECSVDSGENGHVVVELVSGEVGDEPCPELTELFDRVDDQYDIQIEYGSRASGAYSMHVDRDVDEVSTTTDKDADGPHASAILYSADLELTYRTTDIYYQKNFTVAPGEADD